jgi:hypothetical protein
LPAEAKAQPIGAGWWREVGENMDVLLDDLGVKVKAEERRRTIDSRMKEGKKTTATKAPKRREIPTGIHRGKDDRR